MPLDALGLLIYWRVQVDVASSASIKKVLSAIQVLNPAARVLKTTRGKVEASDVVGTGLFDMDKASVQAGLFFTGIGCSCVYSHLSQPSNLSNLLTVWSGRMATQYAGGDQA
jgi:hypothetical protein